MLKKKGPVMEPVRNAMKAGPSSSIGSPTPTGERSPVWPGGALGSLVAPDQAPKSTRKNASVTITASNPIAKAVGEMRRMMEVMVVGSVRYPIDAQIWQGLPVLPPGMEFPGSLSPTPDACPLTLDTSYLPTPTTPHNPSHAAPGPAPSPRPAPPPGKADRCRGTGWGAGTAHTSSRCRS